MYIITGATGNTGSVIAQQLLEAGKEVTTVSRSKERLRDLKKQGARPAEADLLNSQTLSDIFKGAKAAYLLIPSNYQAEDFRAYQNEVAESIGVALESSTITHAVVLSSIGAHLEQGAGVVQGLHDMEKRLRQLEGKNILFLRPTFFMENFYAQIPLIKEHNMIAYAAWDDIKTSMIATKDIANFAAERLIKLDFEGHSHQYLLGERDLSFPEATRILGEAIGKPELNYVSLSYEQAKQGFLQAGFSKDVADRYNEFIESLNQGRITEDAERNRETTTPTSIENFAQQFARTYQQ